MNIVELGNIVVPISAAHDYFLQAMVMSGPEREEWIAKGIQRLRDAMAIADDSNLPTVRRTSSLPEYIKARG